LSTVKQELTSLQVRINEAEKDRREAQRELKAGTTELEQTKWISLYEGAVAILTSLRRNEEQLRNMTIVYLTHNP
jgi:hypothetical protein